MEEEKAKGNSGRWQNIGLSSLFLCRFVKTLKSSGSHVCVSLFSNSLLNQTEEM